MTVRLGGFVIHGDSADTLGACLQSLRDVCDEVVAVDSGSRDGSAEIAKTHGARTIAFPWQGYGAARAEAVRALSGCDYLLFLDSDERFAPGAAQVLAQWRADPHKRPVYRVVRRDWVELPERRFVYRSEHKKRLVRRDLACWDASMIVHEALPPHAETGELPLVVEHRFATSLERRVDKEERYALLWAVRAYCEGKRAKGTFLQRPAHVARDGIVKGALWRGGATALRLAWAASAYHARKYELLRALEDGAHPELVAAFRAGRYRELFQLLPPLGAR